MIYVGTVCLRSILLQKIKLHAHITKSMAVSTYRERWTHWLNREVQSMANSRNSDPVIEQFSSLASSHSQSVCEQSSHLHPVSPGQASQAASEVESLDYMDVHEASDQGEDFFSKGPQGVRGVVRACGQQAGYFPHSGSFLDTPSSGQYPCGFSPSGRGSILSGGGE